jgi:hypothetical protein
VKITTTDMKSGKKSYEPGANDNILNVIDHGQDGLNPKKSLPVQLTFGVSVGVFIILIIVTLYYYGVFS